MSETTQVSSLPLPPMQYVSLFSDENVKRGRIPKPPPPITDSYSMFGSQFHTDDVVIRPLESQVILFIYIQYLVYLLILLLFQNFELIYYIIVELFLIQLWEILIILYTELLYIFLFRIFEDYIPILMTIDENYRNWITPLWPHFLI